MTSLTLKVQLKVLRPQLEKFGLPRQGTQGSAGFDLCACLESPVKVPPNGTVFIPSGLALHIGEPGVAAFILSRSGLGTKQGLVVKQGVGLIDSDYQGEVTIALYNLSTEERTINPGDRIAQLVFMPVCQAALVQVADFVAVTTRGVGGFGSTGLHTSQSHVGVAPSAML